MKVAGLDYSLTSPAISVFEGDEWNPGDVTFHYFHKKECLDPRFNQSFYPEWTNQEERHSLLSDWALKCVQGCDIVVIEGYAFAASAGRTFSIGENTGILKFKLWKAGLSYTSQTPPVFKKYATTKGNAKKEDMEVAFVEETGISNIRDLISQRPKDWNPSSDIIDSYFICKWAFHHGFDQLQKDKSALLPRATKRR